MHLTSFAFATFKPPLENVDEEEVQARHSGVHMTSINPFVICDRDQVDVESNVGDDVKQLDTNDALSKNDI